MHELFRSIECEEVGRLLVETGDGGRKDLLNRDAPPPPRRLCAAHVSDQNRAHKTNG